MRRLLLLLLLLLLKLMLLDGFRLHLRRRWRLVLPLERGRRPFQAVPLLLLLLPLLLRRLLMRQRRRAPSRRSTRRRTGTTVRLALPRTIEQRTDLSHPAPAVLGVGRARGHEW